MRSSQQWITLRAPPPPWTKQLILQDDGLVLTLKLNPGQTWLIFRGWTIMIVKLLHNTPVRFYRLSPLSLFFQPEFRSEKVCTPSLIYTNLLNLPLALRVYFYALLLCYTFFFFTISNVLMKTLLRFVQNFANQANTGTCRVCSLSGKTVDTSQNRSEKHLHSPEVWIFLIIFFILCKVVRSISRDCDEKGKKIWAK